MHLTALKWSRELFRPSWTSCSHMLAYFSFTGTLNCAAFTAGIIEAVLNGANFVSYVMLFLTVLA